MSISISRYVSINSAVLGQSIVGVRQLILNLFTVNPLIPPQTYITFTSAAEVGQYFGTNSEEYYRAVSNYFNFISKNNFSPPLIQFSRWVKGGVAGSILGYNADTTLADWQAVSNGSIGLTIGSHTNQLSGLDFTAVESLSAASFVLSGTTNTNTTVDMVSTAGVVVGMSVTGTGIPVNTIVSTITPNTSITISNAATNSATENLTFGQNFSVLEVLLTAINAYSVGGADWTAATMSYANNNFSLVGGVVGPEVIAVQEGATGTDISGFTSAIASIGWLPQANTANGVFIPGAIWSQGSAAESIATTLGNAFNANNNWGTFGFCYTGIPSPIVLTGTIASSSPTVTSINTASLATGMVVTGSNIAAGTTVLAIVNSTSLTLSQNATGSATETLTFTDVNTGLTLSQYQQAAQWNNALVPNFQFKLMVPILAANASVWSSAYPTGLGGIAGVCLTLTNYVAPVTVTTQYYEQCDAVIEAATNYNPGAINSVQNYMFQLFPTLQPLVSSDSVANGYDNQLINYIGVTQNAGQQIAFYQRGFLLGGITAANDSGVYANEQWLKSAITAAIMNLLLAQSYVPANAQGTAQIAATLQSTIQQALLNGTISVGKTLTPSQIQSITTVTNNPLAWQQVQNAGYFLLVVIQPKPNTMPVEYEAVYTLIYSKNDVIRFVQGSDDLI